MRVLVVEDDADLARQLHDCLSDAGYAVDLAPDGEEGHYLGANEPYDAVVLDLIFGTYYMPKDKAPDSYGVSDPMPQSFGEQMLYPFRR